MRSESQVGEVKANEELFASPGEMGALMRSFDWSKTPLGPVQTWSPTLKVTTRLLLSNCCPMLLWWGPDFHQIYNDAYIPVLGGKHPHASLGKPFQECWAEVFNVLGPLARTPFEGGPPTWNEDIPLEVNRHGFVEETHFAIGYSPVPDSTATGGIGGVLATVHETTKKVLAERRVVVVRGLGTHPLESRTAEEACATAASALANHDKDIAFAAIYLIDPDQKCARLAGHTGIDEHASLRPELIDLTGQHDGAWPFARTRQSEKIITVNGLRNRFATLPPGPWTDPSHAAAVVPIKSDIAHQLVGFLVVGISPRLRFDDAYTLFLESVSAQISTSIANARACELENRLALSRVSRESEYRLRESDDRFRAFVNASSEIVYRMSPDWSEVRQMRGRDCFVDVEASPDRAWIEKIPSDEQPRVLAAVNEAIRTRSTFQLEHRVLRRDGNVGWIFSRAVPLLDDDGKIHEWFGVATDITGRKNAEQALLRSEKLASLGRMAATISHEINNPLEAVTNLLFLAQHAENLPLPAHHHLQLAEVELQRVAHITRQSLGFYRESNAPVLTSLNELIDSTLELLKSKLSAKQVVVEKAWRADVKILAVAGELRQVFSNFLANSLDAIDKRGVIRIRIASCPSPHDRAVSNHDRWVRITLADNGKGIPTSVLPRIFEPFFTTKGTVGTGLGLWVTKQIVQKHGGVIRVRSKSEGAHTGTVFSIHLPVQSAPPR